MARIRRWKEKLLLVWFTVLTSSVWTRLRSRTLPDRRPWYMHCAAELISTCAGSAPTATAERRRHMVKRNLRLYGAILCRMANMATPPRAFRLRLQALTCGFLGFLVAAGLAPAAIAGQGRRLPPGSMLASHSIAVIGSGSPSFDFLLEKYFPGVSQTQYFQTVRPLLAIVHNNTLRAVKAYVIKWTMTKADGTVVTATLQVIWQPPPGDPALTGAGNVLGPNGSALGVQLVSPYFHASTRELPALVKGNFAFGLFQAASLRSLTKAAQSASSVQVTLDGAVFGDGVFVGPDTSKLFERFQAEQKAEVDEAKWMESELKKGVTDQQLKDGLSEQIYNGREATATDDASLYTAARGRAASRMLSTLDLSGRTTLEHFSLARAAARLMTLRRQAGK
jgi:hypothetical protein